MIFVIIICFQININQANIVPIAGMPGLINMALRPDIN